jgi:multidrug efflux pump subunit AcrA (membrane-fusion protein)
MKFWVVILVLFLTACGISQTQLPLATETTISVSPTPQIIEVTRVIKVEQTVVVTATPIPLLAQECLNNAMTQRYLRLKWMCSIGARSS